MFAYAIVFRALGTFCAFQTTIEIKSFPEKDLSKIIPIYRSDYSLLMTLPDVDNSGIWSKKWDFVPYTIVMIS